MILKYIGNSFKRGCVQLVRRPMYFLLIVIMPLLCSWFLMDLIKGGSVQNVPVGIVDLDNSIMSRQVLRTLNGLQQVNISHRYSSFAEARDAVQRGEVMGFFLLPEYLEEEALGGRRPVVSYYVNYAFYAPASMQYKCRLPCALWVSPTRRLQPPCNPIKPTSTCQATRSSTMITT